MRSVIWRDDQRKIRDVAGGYGAVLVIGLRTTEVWPRGFEIGWVAFAYLMDVNGMLARGQILDVKLDFYTVLGGCKRRGADALAFRVFQIH